MKNYFVFLCLIFCSSVSASTCEITAFLTKEDQLSLNSYDVTKADLTQSVQARDVDTCLSLAEEKFDLLRGKKNKTLDLALPLKSVRYRFFDFKRGKIFGGEISAKL